MKLGKGFSTCHVIRRKNRGCDKIVSLVLLAVINDCIGNKWEINLI